MKDLVVKQFKLFGSDLNNKWYISNTLEEHQSQYLHKDLVLRGRTINGHTFSGYYDTKEEAEQTLTKYLKQNMRISNKQYVYDLCDKALREGEAFFNIEEGVDWSDVVSAISAECLTRNAANMNAYYKCTSTNDKVTVTCQRKKPELRPSGLTLDQQNEFLNPQSLSEE